MYARKLKSMKEMIGGGRRKQSADQADFRVRKVNKSVKKMAPSIPSLTVIQDAGHAQGSQQKQNRQGISIIKSLKEIGSNKDLLPLEKELVQGDKLGLTFQLKKLYTITKQGERRMEELVRVRSMKQLLTEGEPTKQQDTQQ